MIYLEVTKNLTTPIVSNWTILASIAAIISAISAFRSSQFAKKSIAIVTQTYNDRQANFTLYLIDGFRWTSKKENIKKFLIFHITINNKSDSKSSFKADLEIEYVRKDNSLTRVIMTHDEKHQKIISDNSLSVFPNDIRIEEKGMLSKWVIFEQPSGVFSEFRIEKYSIKITDTLGNVQIVKTGIIKELNYV